MIELNYIAVAINFGCGRENLVMDVCDLLDMQCMYGRDNVELLGSCDYHAMDPHTGTRQWPHLVCKNGMVFVRPDGEWRQLTFAEHCQWVRGILPEVYA